MRKIDRSVLEAILKICYTEEVGEVPDGISIIDMATAISNIELEEL